MEVDKSKAPEVDENSKIIFNRDLCEFGVKLPLNHRQYKPKATLSFPVYKGDQLIATYFLALCSVPKDRDKTDWWDMYLSFVRWESGEIQQQKIVQGAESQQLDFLVIRCAMQDHYQLHFADNFYPGTQGLLDDYLYRHLPYTQLNIPSGHDGIVQEEVSGFSAGFSDAVSGQRA